MQSSYSALARNVQPESGSNMGFPDHVSVKEAIEYDAFRRLADRKQFGPCQAKWAIVSGYRGGYFGPVETLEALLINRVFADPLNDFVEALIRGLEAQREDADAEISIPIAAPACPICRGEGWVCENHPTIAWKNGDPGCCGGAGSPCKCNPVPMQPAPSPAVLALAEARGRRA